MKATGIVRRIDDLGRIVIPRELRERYSIKEGSPMELYVSEGIVLVPYKSVELLTQQVCNLEKAIKEIDIPDNDLKYIISKIKNIENLMTNKSNSEA